MRLWLLLLLLVPISAQELRTAAAHAAELGRARAEDVLKDISALVRCGTRHTLSSRTDKTRGIGAARDYLVTRFNGISAAHDGRLQVEVQTHELPAGPRVPQGVTLDNVIATLPGSDPTSCVVVAAHYDSRIEDVLDFTADAPGANDDASGVAVVLAAAELLAGTHPRASILFACYAGEEQSLLGSAAHAARLEQAGMQVLAVLSNDIVGGVRGSSGQRENNVLRVFSEGVPSGPLNASGRPTRTLIGSESDASSRQLARRVHELALGDSSLLKPRLIFRQDRFLRGGDHKSFNDLGMAAIRFTEPHENYERQHKNVRNVDGQPMGDLVDALDGEYIAKVAQVNALVAGELAAAPAPPRQVRILTAELTPHTELRWEGNAAAKSYAVLLRRTHEPYWTERKAVPTSETKLLLEGYSKDDWLFAVEAVGASGARSLPVFPSPAQR
jgi:hypothetical protein